MQSADLEAPPAQVFEPRRFVELRKKDFMKQALSAESLGMGLFYTINVFWIQFYLGAHPFTVRRPVIDRHRIALSPPEPLAYRQRRLDLVLLRCGAFNDTSFTRTPCVTLSRHECIS